MQTPKNSKITHRSRSVSALLLSAALVACSTAPTDTPEDAGTDDLPAVAVPVVIEFAPRVGTRDFACGQKFSGVGQNGGTTIDAADFRLYVHNVRLVDNAGNEAPITIEEDKKWQHQGVVLLDFEDKSGECTGTTDTNRQIRGTVFGAGRSWKGIRFALGVPFALNHSDVATAPSPLNLSSMFWSWQGGYKFVRIEGTNAGGLGFIVHLGSTGCMKDGSGKVTSCQSPNRADIALDGFSPNTQRIAVDLAALFSATDLGKEVECMSGPGVADCVPLFDRMGLSYGANPAGAQQLFRVE